MEDFTSALEACHRDYDARADEYWWSMHRVEIIVDLAHKYLPAGRALPNYVDVGCGTGSMARMIAKKMRSRGLLAAEALVTGLDRNAGLRGLCARNGVDFKVVDLESGGVPGDCTPERIQLFTAMDVLEHIREPEHLLRGLMEKLSPGALGLITVPACPALYSAWDVLVGHYRRYDEASLRSLLTQSGYRILWQSHLYSFALLPAFLMRNLSRETYVPNQQEHLPQIPEWLNAALKVAGNCERFFLRASPVPWGTSLVAVIQKP